jgi:hypothetical protein
MWVDSSIVVPCPLKWADLFGALHAWVVGRWETNGRVVTRHPRSTGFQPVGVAGASDTDRMPVLRELHPSMRPSKNLARVIQDKKHPSSLSEAKDLLGVGHDLFANEAIRTPVRFFTSLKNDFYLLTIDERLDLWKAL